MGKREITEPKNLKLWRKLGKTSTLHYNSLPDMLVLEEIAMQLLLSKLHTNTVTNICGIFLPLFQIGEK